MLHNDFSLWKIDNFTADEVINTGANLRDVNVLTMVGVQKFRTRIGRPVLLLFGGITTGVHASPQHPGGTAIDVAFRESDGPINIKSMVYAAVDAGFKGIGTYWNGVAWSLHLDLGPEIRRWGRWKRHRSDEGWHKESLIIDVSTL